MYLGLDSSTQSLKALVIDAEAGVIIGSASVNFTDDLPEYKSPNGVLPHADPLVKHSDPLLWVAALDLLMQRLQGSGVDLSAIKGISGCGQQHGSVYVNDYFNEILSKLDPKKTLVEQIQPGLSRKTSPIWMDSSTGKECEYLTSKIGDRLQTDTGSAAIERFTGSQILKFKNEEIEAFKDTVLVHLVSSFVASILVGENCPIDYGDGSGMNMLNLNTNQWDEEILDVIDPLLKDKLLPPVAATSQVGGLSPYFEKYGLKAGTPVVVWTGDNPSSLIGMGAHNPGTVVISLGTSDTFFAAMETFRTDDKGYGHVFGNPAGGCMSLICFKNGSLAREEVKKQQNVDWDYFGNQALTESQPGNGGNLLLPYFVPEITPLVNEAGVKLYGDSDFCSGKASPASYIRAVLETQFQSMFLHSQWIGEDVSRIRVTGGASQSNGICQVIADVFQSPVEKINTTDSAALGGALRAAQAVGGYSFDDLAEKFTTSSQIIQPRREFAEIYKNQRNDLAEKLK